MNTATTTKLTDMTTATPAQIDAELFEIEYQADREFHHAASYRDTARRCREGERGYMPYLADRYEADAEKHAAKGREIHATGNPHRAEYERRGGWTRYVLCIEQGGHYHFGRGCSTLYATTMLTRVAEVSGLTTDELIDHVGHHACTVCFPQAPVHPAWARTMKVEAAAKAADKLAKWEKGRATRAKKVVNVRKRLDKATAEGDQYDIDWNTRDLGYAERELARWDTKRPTA